MHAAELARWVGIPAMATALLIGCGGGGARQPDAAAGPDAAMPDGTTPDGNTPDQNPVDVVPDQGVADKEPADAGGMPPFGGHRIAASRTRSCVVRTGGKLFCWGGTNGEIQRPIAVDGLPSVATVYGGTDDQICALTETGAVWCLKDGAAATAIKELPSGVRQVALGTGFACALRDEGDVMCWGNNSAGQLGDATTTDRPAPVQVMSLADVVQIGAGTAHVCALTGGGKVSCWGNNSHWQLGDGTSIGRFVPVPIVGVDSFVDRIAIGPQHGCARSREGDVSCWGFNASGQASSAGAAFLPSPTRFDALGRVLDLVAGGTYEFGEYDHSLTCGRALDGAVWCAGRGANGQLGDGVLGREGTDIPLRLSALGTSLVDVAIGGQHVCALDDAARVWCWGRNFSGQLGRDTPASAVPLKMTAFGPFSTYDAGENSTCARASNGFYCWGADSAKQAGIGDSTYLAPRFVPGPPADVKQWGTGALLTCWLRTTGQVACMGGRTGRQPTELAVLGSDNIQLAVGNGHACVVKRDGTLWCWGNTMCGAVPTEIDPTAMPLFQSNNIGVFAGVNLTCVQRTDGSIWCCGEGWGMAPIQAPVGTDSVEIALAVDGCARKSGGALLCGPSLRQVQPVAIDGVVQLAMAREATCARKADGSVWCWGKNRRGVLGTGAGDSAVPARVAAPVPLVDVSAGGKHFCGLDASGRLYCWGDNYVGQLGDGLGGDRPLPALVQFP